MTPNLEKLISEKELKKRIMEWQFAVCPTETEEPLFWKWNEHGIEMLIVHYLKGEIQEAYESGRKAGLQEHENE